MEPYSGAILIPTSGGGRGDGACVAAVGLEVKEGAKAEDIPNLAGCCLAAQNPDSVLSTV